MKSPSKQDIQNLFVVDTEAPWIRSLLHAMPPGVGIHGFRVRNAFTFPGGLGSQIRKVGRSERISESWDDTWVSIPGWNKAFALSTWLVTRQLQKAIQHFGQPAVVLFTLPWYAPIAARLVGSVKVYYAHDTFRFYGWNNSRVIPLEKKLLDNCHVGLGVARQVVADLAELSSTPVRYFPMATTFLTEQAVIPGETEAQTDLASVPKPRIGCVGQINSAAYDWDLLEYLGTSFPHAHFVLIGPKFKEKASPAVSRMEAVFARPNIHWLGPKPHAHLAAYLRCFDVCVNPLRVSEHNHRRSPLRLFDYLTTDRPIVTTAIAEASNHLPFVSIAKDREEFRRLLAEALMLKAAPDLERRRNYITANTWHARAAEFSALVGHLEN